MTLFPVYRAFDLGSRTYIADGFLSTKNEFFIPNTSNLPSPVPGVIIDFFTYRIAEDGTPVYVNDIVEIATLNEWGSAVLGRGMVHYNASKMCYEIASEGWDGKDMAMPTKILRVIGHNHD